MIKTNEQYNIVLERIEELLKHSDNIENTEAKGYIELNFLSDMVADYEDKLQ
jgi:HTH-type transcriptional regulator/antitoxin HigA